MEKDATRIETEESGILSEVVLRFQETSDANEGLCSCVCISDEQCCGCIVQ